VRFANRHQARETSISPMVVFPHTASPNSIHKFLYQLYQQMLGSIHFDVLNDVVDGHPGGIQRALAYDSRDARVDGMFEKFAPVQC